MGRRLRAAVLMGKPRIAMAAIRDQGAERLRRAGA
jgi:hypothetical protein